MKQITQIYIENDMKMACGCF